MRSLLLLCLTIFYFSAQAQMPVMKIKDPEMGSSVVLENVEVTVNIAGNIATTSITMSFRNNSDRILEGELTFPMPDGVTVSRYALDINGKMREAVPVEKAKATEVFESIEHRNVDPGLLEKVEGNNFRTRIYPLPVLGIRTVTVGYEEELKSSKGNTLQYHLPLNFKKSIRNFSLTATVSGSMEMPLLEEQPDGNFSFSKKSNNYVAKMERNDFEPHNSLTINLPKTQEPSEIVFQKNTNGSSYFLITDYPVASSRNKTWGNRIGLLWDVSLSGLQRDTKKEMELLGKIINQKQNLTIELALLNYKLRNGGTFVIQNGNWQALRKKLENLIYDGATDFSQIKGPNFTQSIPISSLDEIIFFTDGLSNFGLNTMNLKCPVHIVNSAARADFSLMKLISTINGGSFININNQSAGEGFALLGKENLHFMGIESNTLISEVYPSIPTEVLGHISVAGLMGQGLSKITLLYGFNGKVTQRRAVMIPLKMENGTISVQRIWAQKKIAEMDVNYEKHKKEIAGLAAQFGIVTRNTSLMVLEDINDYVRYGIKPPAELLSEYNRLAKTNNVVEEQRVNDLLQQAFEMTNDLKEWWRTKFIVNKFYPNTQNSNYPTPSNVVTTDSRTNSIDTVQAENLQNVFTDTRTVTLESEKSEKAPSSLPPLSLQLITIPYDVNNRAPGIVDKKFVIDGEKLNDLPTRRIEDAASVSSNIQQVRSGSALRIGGGRADGTVYKIDGVMVQNSANNESETINYTPPNTQWTSAQNLSSFSSGTPASYSSYSSSGAITIPEFENKKEYIQKLKGKKAKDAYAIYLSLRNDYLTTPTFYYDVAGWFFQKNSKDTGLMILSNIAELDLENAELYKMLAYQLKQNSYYEKELWVTKKILEWRPMDPQSIRDYALALVDNMQYQQALDTLYSVLLKSYNPESAGRDDGIEEVIVMEINQLISLHRTSLNLSKIDKRVIANLPVDIRVVLNWNKMDTDIDLWIIAPNGEKCYYSEPSTSAGGRLSNDFTDGFGPEQFLLRKAIKGKYKIQTNFFDETQLSISGPTTLMAEIFLHYADGRQTRKIITLQSVDKGSEQEFITIGEFSF